MKSFFWVCLALLAGLFLQYQFTLIPHSEPLSPSDQTASSADKQVLYWVAPMDKNYRRDKPGKSPMGMDLVPVYDEQEEDGVVKISPTVINNLGVRIASVESSILNDPIQTVGIVEYDESRIMHLHSRAEGWIEKLYVSAQGDPVKKGQTLFELYSPVLVNAQNEYLLELKRGNNKFIKASASKLRSLGLSDEHINYIKRNRKVMERVSFKAPFDGVIKMLNVRHGMFVKPATEVMSVASLESLWVIAELFERQAYKVAHGQSVRVSSSAFPETKWMGMVNYVYPSLDPMTRTLKARIRLANEDLALKPKMLVDLTIANESSLPQLHVPASSVIKGRSLNRVVKFLGDGRFKTIAIEIGEEIYVEGEKHVQVIKGLEKGDQVVVSAQFLIDSESNVDAEILRMSLNEPLENKSQVAETISEVEVSATIHEFLPEMQMVNITHDAIPEWGWPKMTMSLQIEEGLDVDHLTFNKGTLNKSLQANNKLEQKVVAVIEKREGGDFVISALKQHVSNDSESAEMDHD